MNILFVYTNINGLHADGFADGIAMMMAVKKKQVITYVIYEFLKKINILL